MNDDRVWWIISGIVAAVLLGGLFSLKPARAWDLAELNRTVDSANFRVNSGCSGTLIDPGKGLILTAHHCIADHIELVEREVTGRGGMVMTVKVKIIRDVEVEQLDFDDAEHVKTLANRARVLVADKGSDLALIQVIAKLPNTTAARLACSNPVRGEQTYTVGNPVGLYASITAGVVSSLQHTYATIGPIDGDEHGFEGPLMQISGGLVGGHSGGAVYNARGALIGVPVIVNGQAESLGFAVPLPVIKEFLKAAGVDEALWACKGAE